MTVNDATFRVARKKSQSVRRAPSRTAITIGATLFLGATVALGAIVLSDDEPSPRPQQPAPTVEARAREDNTRDLVERGLIPAQSLEPTPQWLADQQRDLAQRELVERGLIPPQSLEPAPK